MGLNRQQREVFQTLRELAGQDRFLVIPRILVRLCGGWEEAAMLSQVLRWSNPDKREGWFYKTRADFAEELELTERQIRRCRDNLEILEFIETKLSRVANSPSTWYRACPATIIEEYKKHRTKRAGDRTKTAAPPDQNGQSSISPIFNTNIPPFFDGEPLTPEEEAEMDRLWNEAQTAPSQQWLFGTRSPQKP